MAPSRSAAQTSRASAIARMTPGRPGWTRRSSCGGGRRDGVGPGAVGLLEVLDDLVVDRAAHEVVHRVEGCRRCTGVGPVGEVLVGDEQVDVVGEVGDGLVDDRDVAEARVLDLATKNRRAHGRGTHAGVDARGCALRVGLCGGGRHCPVLSPVTHFTVKSANTFISVRVCWGQWVGLTNSRTTLAKSPRNRAGSLVLSHTNQH